MVNRHIAFVPGIAASLLLALVALATDLPSIVRTIALACIGLSFGAALLVTRDDIRMHAATALAIAAATATGQGRGGIVYGFGCVTFAVVTLGAMRAPEALAARQAAPSTNARVVAMRPMAILGTVGAVIFGLLVVGLPRLGSALEEPIGRFFLEHDSETSGFSSSMRLGSMRGMLLSDRIVMRVEGQPVDYLRGVVYDHYERRAWTTTRNEPRVLATATSLGEGIGDDAQHEGRTRIVFARGAPVSRGRDARYFLPRNAHALGTSSAKVIVDPMGIVHPSSEDAADEIVFATNPRGGDEPSPKDRPAAAEPATSRVAIPAAPPSDVDLEVPPRLREQLTTIATTFTRGTTADHDQLDAIVRSLGTFGYSLDVTRDEGLDPVIDLLTVHRAGHCEVFASAMALLARSRGIPARVVSGYRVTESNPLSGLAVVRERNAHAWVEAWVDGQWTTWDPTPITEGAPSARSSMLSHLTDLGALVFDRAMRSIERIGVATVLGAAASFLAALLVGRRLVIRLWKRARRTSTRTAEPPLACYAALESALARAGHTRNASEPIERFAERIASTGAPWASDVTSAIAAYAEYRYGGIGDEQTIAELLGATARRVG